MCIYMTSLYSSNCSQCTVYSSIIGVGVTCTLIGGAYSILCVVYVQYNNLSMTNAVESGLSDDICSPSYVG